MRIVELLEGRGDEFLHKFTKSRIGDHGTELDYDLSEDLAFFMNNHDGSYRKHARPIIGKMIDATKANKETKPSMFAHAVRAAYMEYIKEYPIRELPDELDAKTCKEVCDILHDQVKKHISDGKYD
jgi:hypothetical protein